MNNLLDIVGSSAIGLYFVYMIFSFNLKMNDAINIATQNNIALWDSITLGQLADYDFNKIGYRTDSIFVISKAEESEVEFYGDLDNDGIVDTVQYILIDSTYLNSHSFSLNEEANPASVTDNPDDIPLYRIVNGSLYSTENVISLVTDFQITYNDFQGNEINTSLSTHDARKEIKGITINYTVGSSSPVITEFDTTYQVVEWEKEFTPKNIQE